MIYNQDNFPENISEFWQGSVVHKESCLHQLSPYIGKMKSSMASKLISMVTRKSETIYDPFCGSGTIALESWAQGRNIIANDMSLYACFLTRAKLNPCFSLNESYKEMERASKKVSDILHGIDLRKIPKWVRSFFHPKTLRETVAWSMVLKERKSYFLLSCLLGILHHQRPGFLSYPSSHAVPYLRREKFPRDKYSELYEYRPVYGRLVNKVTRALRRLPELDLNLFRKCHMRNAVNFKPELRVNAIITSPPYMRQLDYARDNRLRLWFLGINDIRLLDHKISPCESDFLALMRSCLKLWLRLLTPGAPCVLVLGNTPCRSYNDFLPEVIENIAVQEIDGYKKVFSYTEKIPDVRRVRRRYSGCQGETVLILRKKV